MERLALPARLFASRRVSSPTAAEPLGWASEKERERARASLAAKVEARSLDLTAAEYEVLGRLLAQDPVRHAVARAGASVEELFHALRSKLTGNLGSANVDTMISAYSASPHSTRLSRIARRSSRIDEPPRHEPQDVPRSPRDVERVSEILAAVDRWEFDIWALADAGGGDKARAALSVVEQICFKHRADAISRVGPSSPRRPNWQPAMRAFASAVVDKYRDDVPYHNCLHGADVMQAVHSLLRTNPDFDRAVSSSTLVVALLAALSHDVGHPGLTNAHLVETRHELALRYNDQAPLENFHVALALDLARTTGFWDAAFATVDLQRSARFAWIELTLGTDMAHHVHMISDIQTKLKRDGYDAARPENVVPTLKVLVHCCDLGNPTRDWNTYRTWTDLIMEEFYNQADLEIDNGRTPSLPTRRDCRVDQFQLAFLGFIRPLFVAANDIKRIDLTTQLDNLDATVTRWQRDAPPPPPSRDDSETTPPSA